MVHGEWPGGCGPWAIRYGHLHIGPWRPKYARAFRVLVYRHGRKYLAIQRQWTYCQYQIAHVGRLSYLRRVA